MLGIALTEGIKENLIASAIFWVFDVLLIVGLLPWILNRAQERKWLATREHFAQGLTINAESCAHSVAARLGGVEFKHQKH